VRRLKRRDAPDVELSAVGKSLEEPAADAALHKNVLGLFTAERKPFLQRPPFADFFGEDPEHDFRRALHSNRFSNRHRFSSA
jgi:hypothetical protein